MLATTRMYYLTQLPPARKATEGAAAEHPTPSKKRDLEGRADERRRQPLKKAKLVGDKPVEKGPAVLVEIEDEDSEELLLPNEEEQGLLDVSALRAGAGAEDNEDVLDDCDLEDVMGALQAAFEEERERTEEFEERERELERQRVKDAAVAANRAAAMDYASGVIVRGVVPAEVPPPAPVRRTAAAFGERVLAIWKGFNINSPVLESDYRPPVEAKKSGFAASDNSNFDLEALLAARFHK
jgi:hypothetical protein